MSIVVLGSSGLLGFEMVKLLEQSQTTFRAFGRDEFNLGLLTESEMVDLLDGASTVINCAGFTNVDEAEDHWSEANLVNGLAIARLARASNRVLAKLIHVSTDYVFDGNSYQPYGRFDDRKPTTKYGLSKKIGEDNLFEESDNFVLVRGAWLYGQTRRCFAKTIAKRLSQGEKVNVVNDQVGQPTWAKDLAMRIIELSNLDAGKYVENCTSGGFTSWYEFAIEIAKSLNVDHEELVVPVASQDFESKATRPSWSVLDNEGGLSEPIGNWKERWKVAAPEVLKEFI